jgi:hypothetical protein
LTSFHICASDDVCRSRGSSGGYFSHWFSIRGCAAMVASSCLQELECSWHEFEFPAQAECSKLTKLVFLGLPSLRTWPHSRLGQ